MSSQGLPESFSLFFRTRNTSVKRQTVNLLAHAFAGSNPAPTTILKFKAQKQFYPIFSRIAGAQRGFKKKRNCSSRREEAHFEENQWNRASLRRLLRILESALAGALEQTRKLLGCPSNRK